MVLLFVCFVSLLLFPFTNGFSMATMRPASSSRTNSNLHAAAAAFSSSVAAADNNIQQEPYKFLLVGGTGKIGTAVACHLLLKQPTSEIMLLGRNPSKANAAIQEIKEQHPNANVSFQIVDKNSSRLLDQSLKCTRSPRENNENDRDDFLYPLFQNVDCVIHTAGPYADKYPTVLATAIQAKCPVYIDVSDPLPYLEQGLLLSSKAMSSSNTTALMAAGAFPGMSNVLAMETAAAAAATASTTTRPIQDLLFQYFTAGLGGSGTVNLYITNLGFGEPMGTYDQGQLRFYTVLSGLLLGTVDFFLNSNDYDYDDNNNNNNNNLAAKERVGTKQVFAWPFPEAATVARHLNIRGKSVAAMGTSPDLWNTILGILVQLIPRAWWRNERFSQFLADFSEPMVYVTDQISKFNDRAAGLGETHAMRIDVSTIDGSTMTTVQAHDSFRQCVGQSCAEFALDCLQYPQPGVYLTEQRYDDPRARQRIISKLTSTPGTFCYTGPVATSGNGVHQSQPTKLDEALQEANQAEMSQFQ